MVVVCPVAGTLAALEGGRITLAKARILIAETLNLSEQHTAQVEAQVLAKAAKQTPGQLRAAARRAVLSADLSAAQERAEQARREHGVQMWPGRSSPVIWTGTPRARSPGSSMSGGS